MDTELAREVLDDIRMNPEKHSQRNFAGRSFCGTTLCIAGNVMLRRGYTLDWYTERYEELQIFRFRNARGDAVQPYSAATALLGLTWQEAQMLFYCMDDAAAVELLETMTKNAENDRAPLEGVVPVSHYGEDYVVIHDELMLGWETEAARVPHEDSAQCWVRDEGSA